MAKNGNILYIEDDHDDVFMFTQVLEDLGISDPLIHFSNSTQALEYLNTTTDHIFIIFCDINLPGDSGLEFKMTIDYTPELRRKSIPFVFYSTTATVADVDLAYSTLTVQGFFQKPNDYKTMASVIKVILDYWFLCQHPNTG